MKKPIDPRPELTDDSHRWQRLLELAYALPEENMDGVYGSLLGLRCMGVRLFMINDKLQMTHGEMDPEEYKQCREKYLLPFASKIAALIGRVG